MSIFDHALHIPAEQVFFAPAVAQHERVLLPLTAGVSPRFVAAIALAAFAALACLCMGSEMALSRGSGTGALVFAVCLMAASLIPAAIAVVGLRDAGRPAPLLVIDAAGVRDARLGPDRIAWADVDAVTLVSSASGINAVRLTLLREGPARFNPWRIGGWSADWGRRRRTRLVALMLLDVRAHALAHTILVLAARHGAKIEAPA